MNENNIDVKFCKKCGFKLPNDNRKMCIHCGYNNSYGNLFNEKPVIDNNVNNVTITKENTATAASIAFIIISIGNLITIAPIAFIFLLIWLFLGGLSNSAVAYMSGLLASSGYLVFSAAAIIISLINNNGKCSFRTSFIILGLIFTLLVLIPGLVFISN